MADHEIQERLGAQHRRALVLISVAALDWVITRQVRQHVRGEQTAALHSLLILLWLVVAVF